MCPLQPLLLSIFPLSARATNTTLFPLLPRTYKHIALTLHAWRNCFWPASNWHSVIICNYKHTHPPIIYCLYLLNVWLLLLCRAFKANSWWYTIPVVSGRIKKTGAKIKRVKLVSSFSSSKSLHASAVTSISFWNEYFIVAVYSRCILCRARPVYLYTAL